MEALIAYIIKVNIALIFFYLLYVIFLKKDTFFAFRRYFILAATVFSFVYPFITVSAWENIISFEKPQKYTTQVTVEDPAFAVVLADEVQTAEPVNTININWWQVLLLLLSAGVVFFLARFTWQLVSILQIKHKSIRKNIDGMEVFDLYDEITPFSFFRWIFIHLDSHSDTEIKQILLHEQTHARQWHSVDIILMELLCVFLWWNPIIWLMKRETSINLEHLADNGVLRKGVNSRDYQYYLLRLTYHQNATRIVNNFNVSLLKQRITMMNKTKSPARKLVKYLIALPLALLLMAGNSVYAQNQRESEIFTEVEKYPEFPGGNQAFMKYLVESIKYPVKAQENNEQGRVITNFVVEKDGSISNIKVIRGVTAALDAEAVRLLNSMPNWQSGEHQGKPARVRFTLPIVFRLQGGSAGKSQSPVTPVSADVNEKGKILDEVVVVGYGPTHRESIPSPQEFAESKDNELFIVVEVQPQYPGGDITMNKFISDNLQYPKIAQENGIQGRVITQFIVEKDGSLSDIQVVRGVDPSLDKEAIRLIRLMPEWIPGTQRGNKVRVRYTLPVTFRLSDEAPTVEAAKGVQGKLNDPAIKIGSSDATFVVVEEQPEFPGGNAAMMNFITENIRYPKEAHEKGIQGRVITKFIVRKDGSIDSVQIARGVDPLLDAEAIRVVESMPTWKPGKQRGQPVNVMFTLPVVFRLDKKTEDGIQKSQTSSKNVQNPEFPGGENAYMKFLSDNIKYPVIAQENGIQGFIDAVFNIDTKGKVTFVKFNRSVDPSLDKEVKRVIELMPDWIPGKFNGAATSITSGASFVFRLQGDGVDEYKGPTPSNAIVVVGYGSSKK